MDKATLTKLRIHSSAQQRFRGPRDCRSRSYHLIKITSGKRSCTNLAIYDLTSWNFNSWITRQSVRVRPPMPSRILKVLPSVQRMSLAFRILILQQDEPTIRIKVRLRWCSMGSGPKLVFYVALGHPYIYSCIRESLTSGIHRIASLRQSR